MPTVKFGLDHADRPIIKLYLCVASAEREMRHQLKMVSLLQSVLAMVDTGASRTVVQHDYLLRMATDPTGTTALHSLTTGGTPEKARLYAVDLVLPEPKGRLLVADLEIAAAEDLSQLGVQVLLGRDVLSRCLLLYDGPNREITLTIPPFEEP